MKPQFKPWLILALIFVAGGLTGSALTMALSAHNPGEHPPGPAQMRTHWMARLSQRLHLTADQEQKVQPILEDAGAKIQALHRDEVDRGAEIIKSTDEKISSLLTPEQNAELKKMQAEREKMFSGHLRPWGPPREGPGMRRRDAGTDGAMMPPPPVPHDEPPPGH